MINQSLNGIMLNTVTVQAGVPITHRSIHRSPWLLILAILLGSIGPSFTGAGIAAADGRMDYRDVAELQAVLQDLSDGSRHAQLFTIGYSPNYEADPNHPVRYPIYAIRIAASTNETIEDDYRKNSILFECGMHPREWLATESCLTLAEYLVGHAQDESSGVPELLANADVWMIPLSTPAGRAIDDTHHGDPRYYARPRAGGWRGNGDTRDCSIGVNVARNFSRDWFAAPADCQGDNAADYRGFMPFSTEEATALRNFVQNHSISMAVVVHTPFEKIWNMWGNRDTAGATITFFARAAWKANLDDARLGLDRRKYGDGTGKFSAWLAWPSDARLQPDYDTVRGIQTIFIELPFLGDDYAGDYRYRDEGNRFHPSGDHVRDLIQGSFIPMAKDLISDARSPGCPPVKDVPSAFMPSISEMCPAHDFGLVGARISQTQFGRGQLESYPARKQPDGSIALARDYLAVGQYDLRYRVQNFSAGQASTDVDVKITLVKDATPGVPPVAVDWEIRSFRGLSVREARTGHFPLNISRANADYTLIIEARPAGGFNSGDVDDFNHNDKKIYRFRSYELY